MGNTSTANLRKWRDHPDANSYIQEAIESNLGESHSKFADAAPTLAERLIHLGLSPDVRPYAAIEPYQSVLRSCSKELLIKTIGKKLIK